MKENRSAIVLESRQDLKDFLDTHAETLYDAIDFNALPEGHGKRTLRTVLLFADLFERVMELSELQEILEEHELSPKMIVFSEQVTAEGEEESQFLLFIYSD